ncbi:MAG: endonuclease III [Thermomicrobiales bacterium]
MSANQQRVASEQPGAIDWILTRLRQQYGEPDRGQVLPPIDELVMTMLSQHTSDANTERAFASLRSAFPDWNAVTLASDAQIADAIRGGGLADVKAPRIRQALVDIRDWVGSFDLSFLADRPVGEAREWLMSLHGVGPKTASCVLLFSLDRPAMPVDTHVHRVALRLRLVPQGTSAERAHELIESIVPDEEMFAAHMLFIRHGRATCVARRPRCAACVLVQCCPAAGTFLDDRQEQHDRQAH